MTLAQFYDHFCHQVPLQYIVPLVIGIEIRTDHFIQAGQSHLIYCSQNFQEIVITPTSLETFGFDPDVDCLLLPQKIQGEMTEHCQIVVSMAGANA